MEANGHPNQPGAAGSPAAAHGQTRALITLKGVVKTYVTPAGSFTALRGIDWQIRKGEFAAVVGRSGSGKTTLLNMITGIDRPTTGQVIAGGDGEAQPIQGMGESQTARWRGRTVGIVFQFFQLLPALTVEENIMLAMDFGRVIPSRRRKARALELLERVGIAAQARKLPAMLSGGEQQRAAIARAMANDPALLVADEPTGNLDTHTAAEVIRLLEDQAAAGKTVVVVTHDTEVAARAHSTITLVDGRITDGGSR